MSEWQSIETAPNDQRAILGYHVRSGIMHVTWRDGIGSGRYVRHGEPDGRGWRPTHWMPLPDRPHQ